MVFDLGIADNVFGTGDDSVDVVQQGGALLALASAFLFGASTPIAKLLLGIADPLLLAGLLYLSSGAGLALVKIGGRSLGLARSEAPLRARDLPWLAAIVVFGGILGPALLMWGLTLAPASTGALLLNTESLATMAIAWVVFRENVDRRIFAGAMAILAGAGHRQLELGGTLLLKF
jgi:drug/metabolite transporter (DMT)-like permease